MEYAFLAKSICYSISVKNIHLQIQLCYSRVSIPVKVLLTRKGNHPPQQSTWKQTCSLLSRVRPGLWPRQAPLSTGFSRQECWSGLPFPSPGDLPNPGIESRSPALVRRSITPELPEKAPWKWCMTCRQEAGHGTAGARGRGIKQPTSMSSVCLSHVKGGRDRVLLHGLRTAGKEEEPPGFVARGRPVCPLSGRGCGEGNQDAVVQPDWPISSHSRTSSGHAAALLYVSVLLWLKQPTFLLFANQ